MKIPLSILLIIISGCSKIKLTNNDSNNNDLKTIYSIVDNKLLIGKWVEYKTEWRDGSNLDGNGNVLKWDSKWEFKPNNICISDPYKKMKYELHGDTLYFSEHSQYLIEKLDSNELIIIGISKFGSGKMDVRQYFLKEK